MLGRLPDRRSVGLPFQWSVWRMSPDARSGLRALGLPPVRLERRLGLSATDGDAVERPVRGPTHPKASLRVGGPGASAVLVFALASSVSAPQTAPADRSF